jgi:superfamily II RNA helicase
VKSRFNLSFHSVVNLLERYDDDEIQRLLSRSFLAWQRSSQQEALAEQIEVRRTQLAMEERTEESRHGTGRARKQIAKLERRLEQDRRWLYEQFLRKVSFLEGIGYLRDREVCAGGHIVQYVQIEEIFVAELVLAGVFEDLSPEDLFGVCCGLVADLPPKVTVTLRVPRPISQILDSILDVFESDIIETAMELAGGEPRYDPRVMALGVQWAHGESLADLLTHVRGNSDHAGDLVVAFRRAKDLLGQLRHVYQNEEQRLAELRAIIRAVTRDEVEAI